MSWPIKATFTARKSSSAIVLINGLFLVLFMGSLILGFRNGSWLHKDRILAYPLIILALTVAATCYVLISNDGLLPNGAPFGSDFVSFWTAAREALAGNAHVPYDRTLFEPVQRALFPASGYFAFFYPPHYLAYMMPLGTMPYYMALIVWMTVSFAAASWALIKIVGFPIQTILLALAFPATFLTVSHGQNAFLSASLLGGALILLPTRPVVAGILFGLLSFKPQFGLLIPLALIAGGYWRTIISAGATLIVLIALSSLMFGMEIWTVFLAQSGDAVEAMREGLVAWEKMISPYVALRLAGLSDGAASIIHWTIALALALVVFWAWLKRSGIAYETQCALLLTAALIVTPFSLNYDLFILAPALCFLAARGMRYGFLPFEMSLIAVTYMAPILVLYFMSYGIAIASIFTLVFFALLMRRAVYEARAMAPMPLATPAE